ncbi:MAG: acetate/propionate family kinase [Streptosporangiales bacterium]|nr:acetate/propionate family kinase [Streptosporangiales bacterium]
MRVLVVNAGSSSLKLTLLDHDDSTVAHRQVAVHEGTWEHDDLRDALRDVPAPDAIGHRVVHGGREFTAPVRLDDGVLRSLEALSDLAPLHQPKSLAGIEAVGSLLPEVPAAACFDTAFHADLPPAAATYAVPAQWREQYGVRRYGFHGLSHAYAARRAAVMLDREPSGLRLVSCHLGAGASLAAVAGGRCVDTTMGFTPLDGLVMATRSGSVDPGLVLWLNQHAGVAVPEIADALEHAAGLRGLAGTSDMRDVLTGASRGDSDAELALAVYLRSLRAGIAAMTAALGGLDVLLFTGGAGEHAAEVRAAAAGGLEYLGVRIDQARNTDSQGDGEITAAGAAVRTLVVTAREDLEIAAGTRQVLAPA